MALMNPAHAIPALRGAIQLRSRRPGCIWGVQGPLPACGEYWLCSLAGPPVLQAAQPMALEGDGSAIRPRSRHNAPPPPTAAAACRAAGAATSVPCPLSWTSSRQTWPPKTPWSQAPTKVGGTAQAAATCVQKHAACRHRSACGRETRPPRPSRPAGIGLEIVRLIAQRPGTRTVLAARNEERGRAALAKLQAELPPGAAERVEFAQLDITSPESIQSFRQWAAQELRHVDVLINNAGEGAAAAVCVCSADDALQHTDCLRAAAPCAGFAYKGDTWGAEEAQVGPAFSSCKGGSPPPPCSDGS